MKVLKYSLISLLGLMTLAIVSVLFYLNYLKKGALPDYNAGTTIQGIGYEVTVYRDSFSIQHIYAQNETDFYKAVGFVMAEERFWQMDLLRRVTLGRLSEMFGANLLDTDVLMRALRISAKSENFLLNADQKMVDALEAFAEGVNHYIRNYPIPPEFKMLGCHPQFWEPLYFVNLIGYMAWDLTLPWENEVLLISDKQAGWR